MKSLIVFILIMLGLFGCASIPPMTHDQCNATKFPTAHEHELCLKAAQDYEQAEHEKEDRRLVKRDELIAFLNACDYALDLVIFEKVYGRSCLPNSRNRSKARREYGYPYTHDNVCRHGVKSDFRCLTYSQVSDLLRQLGY